MNGRPTAAHAALSILFAAVLVTLAPLGAERAAPAVVFVPDPGAEGAPPLENQTWRVEGPGYVAELALLDEAGRRAIVQRRTGSPEDPFAPMPGERSGLLTFLLRIENRGKGDLAFEAGAARLVGRDKESFYPVGWPDIQSAYNLLGREVPAVQARARDLLLDGQKVVRAGAKEEGILLFRVPPAGTKKFRLEIALTLPDGSGIGLGAPYRLVRK